MPQNPIHKNYQWYKIAGSTAELFADAINELKIIEIAGRKMTAARYKENIFLIAHKCPHAGGTLADGFIDATGNIVCPIHRYRFTLQNGRNVSGEGYHLKTWPVEIRVDGIYAGLEQDGILSGLK